MDPLRNKSESSSETSIMGRNIISSAKLLTNNSISAYSITEVGFCCLDVEVGRFIHNKLDINSKYSLQLLSYFLVSKI